MRARARRGGFAAALAVCLLAALGSLAAGSFYAVVEARRSANRSSHLEEAASAADVAMFAALDRWTPRSRDSLPIGTTDSGLAHVTRLTSRLFWVTAVGEVATGTSVEAVRMHNLLVEDLQPAVSTRAAITSAGAVVAGPDVVVSGSDSRPPGWTECPAADTASVPAVVVSGDLATYEALGRVPRAGLAARADITLPAGAIMSPAPDLAGHCEASDSSTHAESWGEPTRSGQSAPCESFFPVVHALGPLHLTSGRGQGILIVNGRLRIDGPFLYHGVVIATGGLETRGSNVTIYGAVLSAAQRDVVWDAAGHVRRSTCAIARASAAAARLYPLRRRAWAELF